MYSIEKELDVPIEWNYSRDKVTIEITFHRNGEVINILVAGKAPDEEIAEIIKENLREIQTDIMWYIHNEEKEAIYLMNFA